MAEEKVLETKDNRIKNLGKYGKEGGPGKPKGLLSGRSQALLILDKVAGKAGNKKLLEKDLDNDFKISPKRFFRTYIMPLLPKDSNVKMTGDGEGVVFNIITKNGNDRDKH